MDGSAGNARGGVSRSRMTTLRAVSRSDPSAAFALRKEFQTFPEDPLKKWRALPIETL